MKNKLDIIGIGLANTDMVTGFDLTNSAMVDTPYTKGGCTVLPTQHFNTLLSSIQKYKLFPGGSAANTIRNLSSFGINTGFCGLVGDDKYGKLFNENLQSIGIKSFVNVVKNSNSRICINAIHDDGEKTMFASHALNTIDESIVRGIPNANHIMIEGSIASKNINLARAIKNKSCKMILTLSGLSAGKIDRDWFYETIPYADILFCNESEYKEIDLKYMRMPNVCVKTLGANGCDVYINNKWQHYDATQLNKSDIVNTTGAGDAFASGFLYGLIKEFPLPITVGIANDTAVRVLKTELSYITR